MTISAPKYLEMAVPRPWIARMSVKTLDGLLRKVRRFRDDNWCSALCVHLRNHGWRNKLDWQDMGFEGPCPPETFDLTPFYSRLKSELGTELALKIAHKVNLLDWAAPWEDVKELVEDLKLDVNSLIVHYFELGDVESLRCLDFDVTPEMIAALVQFTERTKRISKMNVTELIAAKSKVWAEFCTQQMLPVAYEALELTPLCVRERMVLALVNASLGRNPQDRKYLIESNCLGYLSPLNIRRCKLHDHKLLRSLVTGEKCPVRREKTLLRYLSDLFLLDREDLLASVDAMVLLGNLPAQSATAASIVGRLFRGNVEAADFFVQANQPEYLAAVDADWNQLTEQDVWLECMYVLAESKQCLPSWMLFVDDARARLVAARNIRRHRVMCDSIWREYFTVVSNESRHFCERRLFQECLAAELRLDMDKPQTEVVIQLKRAPQQTSEMAAQTLMRHCRCAFKQDTSDQSELVEIKSVWYCSDLVKYAALLPYMTRLHIAPWLVPVEEDHVEMVTELISNHLTSMAELKRVQECFPLPQSCIDAIYLRALRQGNLELASISQHDAAIESLCAVAMSYDPALDANKASILEKLDLKIPEKVARFIKALEVSDWPLLAKKYPEMLGQVILIGVNKRWDIAELLDLVEVPVQVFASRKSCEHLAGASAKASAALILWMDPESDLWNELFPGAFDHKEALLLRNMIAFELASEDSSLSNLSSRDWYGIT